jgi:hypothetical protein
LKSLRRFVFQMTGSSFPTLCETDEGKACVIKMKGAGNGPRSLISEFVVNETAGALGWPVPQVFPIEIPPNFPWSFGTDEFDDLVKKSFGVNLGFELIPEAKTLTLPETQKLSGEFKSILIALDLFFVNFDRTAKSQNILQDKDGQNWIIDHGSCLALQTTRSFPFGLPPDHIFASYPRELAPLIREKLQMLVEFADYVEIFEKIPMEWLTESGLLLADLRKNWLWQRQEAAAFSL